MANSPLTPSQLAGYLKPTTTPSGSSGLLTPAQLASYASLHTSNSPTGINSSWDAFDKATGNTKNAKPDLNLGIGDLQKENNDSIGKEVSGLGNDLSSRAEHIADVFRSGQNRDLLSPTEALTSGAKIAAEATGGIKDIFTRGMKALTEVISNNPEVQKLATSKGMGGILEYISGAGQELKDEMKPENNPGIAHLDAFAKDHPQLVSFIKNLADTGVNLSMIAGGPEAKKITGEVGGEAKDLITTGVDNAAGAIKKNVVDPITGKINSMNDAITAKMNETPPLDQTKVTDLYTRAIRPTVTGKANAGQIANANARVMTGLQTIADNAPNLKLVDADGQVIQGAHPKTVDQLSQAIDQTKAQVFKEYDAMAKASGEAGSTVDFGKSVSKNDKGEMTTIGDELDTIANSKPLQIADPKSAKYAQDLKNRILNDGVDAEGKPIRRPPMSTEDVQNLIQHYNAKLKAYYRNPGNMSASEASIDAMVVNKLRAMQDATIESTQGPGYQTLKSKYGALSSMEKDVAHRAVVWGRQNNVGFAGSLSNMASGAEVVRGLLTGNPVDMAIGATIKGVELLNKYRNNPDVGISKIFDEFTKTAPRGPSSSLPSDTNMSGQTKPQGPESKAGETLPQDSMEGGKSQGNLFEGITPKGIKYKIENPAEDGKFLNKPKRKLK